MESSEYGVSAMVRLFINMLELSVVIAFDNGPIAGLYPNPVRDVSEIVNVDKDDADGSIMLSLDMV